jgi:hypothetical protein
LELPVAHHAAGHRGGAGEVLGPIQERTQALPRENRRPHAYLNLAEGSAGRRLSSTLAIYMA